MAIFRSVHVSFWTDAKVADDMTPEDKYFFLYLLTNPHGNILGCYEFSFRQAEAETGYQRDTIRKLINRMISVHHVVDYDEKTREILIFHWYRYNWSASDRLKKSLYKTLGTVKTKRFHDYLKQVVKAYPNDTVCIPYPYRTDTVPLSDISNQISDISNQVSGESASGDQIYSPGSERTTDTVSSARKVVEYLNRVCGTHYHASTRKTKTLIHAREQEGFTLDDFKTVIDKKAQEWAGDPKMSRYLRPETLFGPKFEGYLNQPQLKDDAPSDSSWLSLLGGEEDDA